MTVGELKKRLQDYPDDIPVIVESHSLFVAKKEIKDAVDDMTVISPRLDHITGKNVFKKYKRTRYRLCLDGSESHPDDYVNGFYEKDVSVFETTEDSVVEAEECFHDVSLVIGEHNISVGETEIDHIGKRKFYPIALLIS